MQRRIKSINLWGEVTAATTGWICGNGVTVLDTITSTISIALLVPYLGWGIYTLRRRFRFHDEFNVVTEVVTLIAVGLWFASEIALMRQYMREQPALFIFAVLGLFVSGTALYGPMLTSLISHMIVDVIMPVDKSDPNQPRYGPGEALERQGDYEGAIGEYMVIARMFPKDPTAAVRIADNFTKIGQFINAAPWFERSLELLDSPEKSLPVINRLADICIQRLNQPERAAAAFEMFLSRYPDAEYASSVQQRLARLEEGEHPAVPNISKPHISLDSP